MTASFRLLALATMTTLLAACSGGAGGGAESAPAKLDTDAQKFGYAIGIDLGTSLKPVAEEVDIAALKAGLDDAFAGRPAKLDEAAREAIKNTVAQNLQNKQLAERAKAASAAKERGEQFLADNAKREGVITTASGLQYEVLRAGEGPSPSATDEVTVHYRGTLIDGTEFDSSYARGEPVTFPLSNVIAGWTEGVQLMSPGAKFKFFIPSELAYGERGAGSRIGPNETLIFEVELLEVKKGS